MTIEYTYYTEMLPGSTREGPAGLYRARVDSPLYLEALGRDGKWHFSPRLVHAFTGGDTLNIGEVSEAVARKTFDHMGGEKW